MSHYGTYLGGIVRAPGAERQPPPARPEDRPRYGQIGRRVLDALETPSTVGELSRCLGWDHSRTRSMVHALVRRGQVRLVGWGTVPQGKKPRQGGQRAGRYQRVTA